MNLRPCFSRLFLCALLFSSLASAEPIRLLEEREGWSWAKREWETAPTFRVFWVKPKADAEQGPLLRVRSTLPAWDTTVGRGLVFSEEVAEVHLRGRMRVENVIAGGKDFMAARVQLSFQDNRGDMLGGWPKGEIVHGTRDWFTFEQTHRPPPGARGLGLMVGLVNCTGLVEFSGLEVEAFAASGRSVPLLAPPQEERTDTTDWWTFTPPPADGDVPAVNIGRLLGQGEAGARGPVRARGGDLVYAGGGTVRFWGTNVSPPATWPSPEDGVRMAENLARAGINLVRLHHMDRGWHADNIFESTVDHTQSFDAGKLDRLHRFTAELRKRGIYVSMDLLVTRRFRAGDEVEAFSELEFGGKMAAHFDDRLFELQKDYARRLLATPNPYTGLSYAKDPAVAFISIINESSLFLNGAISSYQKLPQVYRQRLMEAFAKRQQARGLALPAGDVLTLFNRRDPDFWDFLLETQNHGYDRMARFLREDLGVVGLLGGSNFVEFAADLQSNARLDFIDAHVYWDHPVGGWSELDGVSNRSLVPTLAGAGPFRAIAAQQSDRLPHAVSEWQACWPNEHLAEFPPLMAALGGMQGWDAPQWFVFEGAEFSDRMSGVFSADNKPHARVAAAFSALVFRRGDFAPLQPRATSYTKALPWESVNAPMLSHLKSLKVICLF